MHAMAQQSTSVAKSLHGSWRATEWVLMVGKDSGGCSGFETLSSKTREANSTAFPVVDLFIFGPLLYVATHSCGGVLLFVNP